MHLPASFTQPGFFDLLCDAFFQLRLAKDATNPYAQNRHSRSCIIASVFSVESCANCLLEQVNLPSDKKAKKEKRPVLEKLGFCVGALVNAELDNQRIEVCEMIELIKARNDFVHPKVTTVDTEMGAIEDLGDVLSWPVFLRPQFRKSTQLPINGLFWNAEHASDALSVVLRFLSYVFNELLKPLQGIAASVLNPKICTQIDGTSVIIQCPIHDLDMELTNASEMGFDLSFLGIGKANSVSS